MKRYNPRTELLLDRLRQWHREPEVLFWVYAFPLLLIVGLGIAFSEGGDRELRVRVAAEREDRSERLVAILRDGGVSAETVSFENAEQGGAGAWDLTVIERGGSVEYRFDPRQPESRWGRERVDRLLQEAAGRSDPLPVTTVEEDRPGSRYIDWALPGLLGLNIMGSSMWGVGFTAVDLRIRKLLKRFSATPMRREDFLLALLGSRLVFLAAEVVVILAFGRFLFGVPIRGGFAAIVALCLLGAAAFSALSLLIGARADKLETISGLMNAVQVPMWLCSGVFFSAERFPAAVQPVIQALPLTQLNNALRGVMLEGGGLASQWPAIAGLTLWMTLSFTLALRWFRWR